MKARNAVVAVLLVAGCVAAAPGSGPKRLEGWTVTVYYTAVEEHHDGPPRRVVGCPKLECAHGDTDLGSYPRDFVTAVRDEGAGRITSGRHVGRYLNWSYGVGYWLDTAPRDTDGRRLRPYVSAAADPDVLPAGTRVRITDCGAEPDGAAIDRRVCARLRAARWRVVDEFTPGLGGARHLDLYLGEETGPGFTDSPWYATLAGARLTIRPRREP